MNIPILRFAYFEFQLGVLEAIELPAEKSNLFHGALGRALERISTPCRDYFYNPSPPAQWINSETPPRPYVLKPLLDNRTSYAPNDFLKFGIILYGAALDYFMVVFAAIQHLGEFMGLGKQRGHFHIVNIQQQTTQGLQMIYQHQQWLGLADAMQAEVFLPMPPLPVEYVRLSYLTRLRLKEHNQIVTDTPSFTVLMHRLLSRINALSRMYGQGVMIDAAQKQHLLAQAANIAIEASTLQWQDQQRYSKRTESSMPFGGLSGATVYHGALTEFVPWLRLGEWIGIGGKTSFGLGLYELAEDK